MLAPAVMMEHEHLPASNGVKIKGQAINSRNDLSCTSFVYLLNNYSYYNYYIPFKGIFVKFQGLLKGREVAEVGV